MTPVIPCSTSSAYLIPGTAFTIKKHNHLKNGSFPRKSTRHILSLQRLVLPLPSSVTVFPQYNRNHALLRRSLQHVVSATGTDVAVEEADSPVANEDSGGAPIASADAGETSEKPAIKSEATPAPGQSKRSRPTRKSEMPPVKDEDLVPGATFTGKVRSIQPFGAFVDFGAFSDGLVHVSRMSESYVKDVGEVVSVGQEVKVRVVEANAETGRISLTMRESDDINKLQRKDSTTTETGDKPRPARRNTSKPGQRREENKSSKFVRGQDLEGTVKNLTRAGAFITLPEGEEGFLPTAEEADDGIGTMMGGSSLSVGQEVSVRVLRIGRGQVTLTMKKEEDGKLDMELNQGVVHSATNAFVFAFRKNKEIASFLDEREKVVKAMEESVKPEPSVEIEESEATSDPAEVQDQLVSSDDVPASVTPAIADTVEGEETSEELAVEATVASDVKEVESVESIAPSLDGSAQTIEKGEESSVILDPEGSLSTAQKITEEPPPVNGKPDSTEEIASEFSSPENLDGEKVIQGSVEIESTEKSDPSESQTVEEVGAGSVEYADPSEATDEIQEPSSSESQGVEVVASKATISPALVKKLREETGAGMMDCKKALSETGGDINKAQEFLRKKGLASADKKASRATAEGRIGSYIHDSRIGVLIEVNCETDFVSRGDIFKELVDDLAMQVAACPQVQYLSIEDVPEEIVNKEKEMEMQKEDLLSKPEQFRSKIVEGRIRKRLEELALLEQPYIKNDKVVVKDLVKQTIATIGENMKVKRFVRYNLGEGLEKKSQDFAAEVAAQTAAKTEPTPAKEQPAAAETEDTTPKAPAVAVSAALVKQLREETGAGMMDCKKALSETGGDLEKAQEYLRKKGLSTADKKSSRLAAEGRIGSYIHDSRIGVMIEINSETDFVGRSEKFKELVDDLAMQVAACPQVQYVTIEDIPESIRNKEKEMEMQREDLLSKPENIREKIVEGRVSKRLGELVLLEQPYIKNDSLLVKDLVKQTVAALGENLKVRRFVRFTLGETTDE